MYGGRTRKVDQYYTIPTICLEKSFTRLYQTVPLHTCVASVPKKLVGGGGRLCQANVSLLLPLALGCICTAIIYKWLTISTSAISAPNSPYLTRNPCRSLSRFLNILYCHGMRYQSILSIFEADFSCGDLDPTFVIHSLEINRRLPSGSHPVH